MGLALHVVLLSVKCQKYGVFSGPYFPVFGPEKTPYLETSCSDCEV